MWFVCGLAAAAEKALWDDVEKRSSSACIKALVSISALSSHSAGLILSRTNHARSFISFY